MRIWTYKNADEKAYTFSRRSKNVKKRTKTYEKRILCKFTFTCTQGRQEGGQGGQWPRGPWTLGGPYGVPRASGGLRWLQSPAEGPLAWEEAHGNDTEKPARKAQRPFFCLFEITWFWPEKPSKFGEDLFFWRSHHILYQTEAFFLSVLDFTRPEIRHIWAGPAPTFGPRWPCLYTFFYKNL